MRAWMALLIVVAATAIVMFVLLVPLPIPSPQITLEPVAIYDSIGARVFGFGAVVQHPLAGWPVGNDNPNRYYYCILANHFYHCLT